MSYSQGIQSQKNIPYALNLVNFMDTSRIHISDNNDIGYIFWPQ